MNNFKKFITRVISGIFLGGIFLLSVFYNKFIFYFLVVIFQILSIMELKRMFPNNIDMVYWITICLWLDLMILINLYNYPFISNLSNFNLSVFANFFLSFILIMLAFIIKALANVKNDNKQVFENIVTNFFLFIYFIGALALSFLLFEIKKGLLFLMIVVTNYSHDIFAYFVGKTLGKNPFFRNISPSKTIEGYIGGVIFSVIIGLLIALYTGIFELGKIKIILIILSIATLSAFGDIFESLIKRISNVKESGNIIPGHGGVLDRIDSLVFSIYLSSIIYFIIPS